jgi:hypothetical protein
MSKALKNVSYYLIDIREIKDMPKVKLDRGKKHKKQLEKEENKSYEETNWPWNIAQLSWELHGICHRRRLRCGVKLCN